MTTYSVIPSAANAADSNVGDVANPWLHCPLTPEFTGSTVLVAGDIVELEDGAIFRVSNRFLPNVPGTVGNPIKFRPASGFSKRPLITVNQIPTGYTLYSNNIWKTTYANGVDRVFKLHGHGLRKSASIGGVNPDRPWYFDGTTNDLYIYSEADPTGSIEVLDSVIAFAALFENDEYIDIDDIDFAGGSSATVRIRGGVNNCNFTNSAAYRGMYGWSLSSTTTAIDNNTFTDVTADMCYYWGEDADETVQDGAISLGDGFYIGPGSTNNTFTDVVAKDCSHTGLAFVGNATGNCSGNTVTGYRAVATTTHYMRAYEMQGVATGHCTNNTLQVVDAENVLTQSQIGGNGNTVKYVLLTDTWKSPRKALSVQNAVSLVGADNRICQGNIFEYFIILSTYGHPMRFIQFPTTGPNDSNIIRNGIIGPNEVDDIHLEIAAGVGAQTFQDILFLNPKTPGGSLINDRGTLRTLTDANSQAEFTGMTEDSDAFFDAFVTDTGWQTCIKEMLKSKTGRFALNRIGYKGHGFK